MPTTPSSAYAQDVPPPAPLEYGRVLDIEKRRVVTAETKVSDATLTCDVLIVGGGLGGVAAAEAAAARGFTVILTEPTRTIGGQLTSQLVCPPDENSHIEKANGPSTGRWRALREQVRGHYARSFGIVSGREKNVGACWVSRISALPDVWEKAIQDRLVPHVQASRIKRILTRHQIRSVARFSGNGRFNYADFVDLDTGKVTRIGATFLLDATEDGIAMTLAGLPTVLGQEARSEHGERHAPETARPDWVQSFTYCFLMKWEAEATTNKVERPVEYDYFGSLGEYTLDYVYRGQSPEPFSVTYKVLERTTAKTPLGDRNYLPFWTYRRLLAADSFVNGVMPLGDIALINWRGNDFHEESYLDKPLDEQVRILERGRAFAQGFAHWLQTECPRDDGAGKGYPEMRLLTGADQPGVGADGFALHPYIRESRRLKARVTLTENHLLAPGDDPTAKWGTLFEDSVGCALYAIDIHPNKAEQPLLVPALPHHIPLGAFLTQSGPANVIPAAKNIGMSRLAAASARMHPTEWLCGEIAGSLAAFCLEKKITDPSAVRDAPPLLSQFRQSLQQQGVTLDWRDALK
jgi:hypothetical protein